MNGNNIRTGLLLPSGDGRKYVLERRDNNASPPVVLASLRKVTWEKLPTLRSIQLTNRTRFPMRVKFEIDNDGRATIIVEMK